MSDVEKNIGTHKPGFAGEWVKLGDLLTEYKELNVGNRYRPVAVGRFGIRAREDIYTKELAKDYSKNKVIHQNTLTVGMGSKQIDIGILTSEERYSVSPAYHTYHIGDVDCDYLRYCLEARNADMFKRFAKRGTRQGKTIDLKRWLGYRIYLPSKERQAAVVRRLDAVERQIGDCKAMGQRLDDLVKSRFVEMFGNVSTTCRVQDVATTYNGDRGKNYPTADDKVLAGYPFINAGNLEGGKVSFDSMDYITAEKYQALSGGKIRKDDILYCLRGSLGKSAICDFDGGTIASSLMVIRANIDEVSPRYLFEALNTPDVIRQMHAADNGSSQPNLSAKSVKSYLIPLPSKELQQQFADFVARVDKLRFDVQQQIEKLETLKRSLMQEYFG